MASPWYWDRFDELDRYVDDLPDERDELPDRGDELELRIDSQWDELWEAG